MRILAANSSEDACIPGSVETSTVSSVVGVVTISGSIVHKDGRCVDGLVSYTQIEDSARLLKAQGCNLIGFYYKNVPGGTFNGLLPTANFIKNLGVRTFAYADCATSAGYALFSAVDETYASPSSSLGSIGVLADLTSEAKANEMEGINHVIIRSKAEKALYNPNEPISEQVLAETQEMVNFFDQLFVDTVVQNQNPSPEALNGKTYYGEEAQKLGLFNVLVQNFDEALSLELSRSNSIMTIEELQAEIDTLKAQLAEKDRLVAESKASVTSAIASAQDKNITILKAGSELGIPMAKVVDVLAKNYDPEVAKDIFLAHAEGLATKSAIDTAQVVGSNISAFGATSTDSINFVKGALDA